MIGSLHGASPAELARVGWQSSKSRCGAPCLTLYLALSHAMNLLSTCKKIPAGRILCVSPCEIHNHLQQEA